MPASPPEAYSLAIGRTGRGFPRVVDRDLYGQEWSIQDSSLATEPAIWLGCSPDRAHPDEATSPGAPVEGFGDFGGTWTPAERETLAHLAADLDLSEFAILRLALESYRNHIARMKAGASTSADDCTPRSEEPALPTRTELARIIDPTAWKVDRAGYVVEQIHSGEALEKADHVLMAISAAARRGKR